jgi:hypothetical protein
MYRCAFLHKKNSFVAMVFFAALLNFPMNSGGLLSGIITPKMQNEVIA